jgi:hypothetical protein
VPRIGGLLVPETTEDLDARLKETAAKLDDLKEFL